MFTDSKFYNQENLGCECMVRQEFFRRYERQSDSVVNLGHQKYRLDYTVESESLL